MSTLTRMRRAAVASVLVASIGLAACGDDDDTSPADDADVAEAADAPEAADTTAATTAAETTGETTAAPTTAGTGTGTGTDEPAEPGIVEVALTDYAFGGIPAEVPVGTRFHIQNASKKEVHELVALRLPDDEERSVEQLLKLSEKELDAMFGQQMPAMVLLAPPGGEQIAAVGDGTLEQPGRYVIVCSIPTNADPEEFMKAMQSGEGPPPVKGGPPHFMHGMHAEVVVE